MAKIMLECELEYEFFQSQMIILQMKGYPHYPEICMGFSVMGWETTETRSQPGINTPFAEKAAK